MTRIPAGILSYEVEFSDRSLQTGKSYVLKLYNGMSALASLLESSSPIKVIDQKTFDLNQKKNKRKSSKALNASISLPESKNVVEEEKATKKRKLQYNPVVTGAERRVFRKYFEFIDKDSNDSIR